MYQAVIIQKINSGKTGNFPVGPYDFTFKINFPPEILHGFIEIFVYLQSSEEQVSCIVTSFDV